MLPESGLTSTLMWLCDQGLFVQYCVCVCVCYYPQRDEAFAFSPYLSYCLNQDTVIWSLPVIWSIDKITAASQKANIVVW